MADKYGKKGLIVLAVNIRPNETADQIKGFARGLGLKHVLLQNGAAAASTYHVRGTPTTFFIDSQGSIVEREEGFDAAKLEAGARAVLPAQ